MKTTRAWLVAVCIPAALIATASSSAQASPSTTTGGTLPAAVGSPALCKAIGRLDKLVVRRVDAFPQNGIHFSFPAVVEVDQASSVPTRPGSCATCHRCPPASSPVHSTSGSPTACPSQHRGGCSGPLWWPSRVASWSVDSVGLAGWPGLHTSGTSWARPWGWWMQLTRPSGALRQAAELAAGRSSSAHAQNRGADMVWWPPPSTIVPRRPSAARGCTQLPGRARPGQSVYEPSENPLR